MRSLDGLGVAERSGQSDVAAVEVERFGFGPQAPDDRARFGEAFDRLGEGEVGKAVGRVFAPGLGWARPGADADPELEPAAGDDVDGRGDLGQQRGRADAVARDQQPEAKPAGLGSERR